MEFLDGMELRTLFFIFDLFSTVLQCPLRLVNACVRPCPAVSRCHPSFVEVRCRWSIRVASVFRRFALVCLPVFGTFAQTGRSTCHLCCAFLTYFYTVHGD